MSNNSQRLTPLVMFVRTLVIDRVHEELLIFEHLDCTRLDD